MILNDSAAEVRRIVTQGEERSIRLRALGGLAVYLISPSAASRPHLARSYADIDFAGLEKQVQKIKQLMIEMGYQPDDRFNALHGQTRLIFYNPDDGTHIDIFLDRFKMCHTLDLKQRLLDGYLTLPAVDLLVTKIQIVQMNAKDMQDILALLLDHDPGLEAPGKIDIEYLIKLTSQDWGLFTTLSDNLQRAQSELGNYLENDDVQIVTRRIIDLLKQMDDAPKSLQWKLRSRIGRRVAWYELPEEVNR